MHLRILGATILAFGVVLAAGAMLDGGPNDHPVGALTTYTLIMLGEVSNMMGLGRTMVGAVVVTLLLVLTTILYTVFVLVLPARQRLRRS